MEETEAYRRLFVLHDAYANFCDNPTFENAEVLAQADDMAYELLLTYWLEDEDAG